MPLCGKNILGNSLSAEGDATFRALDPATGQELDVPFVHATAGEVDRAVHLADEAFRGRWPRDAVQTAALLQRIAQEIESLGDELIERCGAETGLPAERLKMERGRTCGQLRLFAQVVEEGSWVDARIDRAQGDRKPLPRPDLRRMLAPIGPVVVFPASNFPLAFSVAGGDTASAFAAGCPVVVKARPAHAGTSELVGMAVQKAVAAAGMPAGWFSMLHGPGRQTGLRLVSHPLVRAVGFTGSLTGGRTICDAAAARPDPIPVYAEMGSINPVFLLPEAMQQRVEAIARGLYQSVTLGVGQFCTNPGLVVALDDEHLARLLEATGRLIARTPPATMLLAAIEESYRQGVRRLADTPGVQLVAEAAQAADRHKTQGAAALLATDAETFLQNHELAREVFGPATLVVRCRRIEQMLDVAESLEGQLTATIHAADGELCQHRRLTAILERKAGRVVLNGFPTGVEVCASMNHGGPYPATSDSHATSVGTAAIYRFARPVCYQNFPESELPEELHDKNARGIWRLVDDVRTKDDV